MSLSPRILIAETDSSGLESLPRCLHEGMPKCEIDLCSSRDHAVQKLLAAPYQLIISGVHLAEMNDFFLLERTGVVQSLIPFVVTATAADKALARTALHRGAFDIITKPLDTQQVRLCLRLVRQHFRLRELLAIERRAWETHQRALTTAQANLDDPMYQRGLDAFSEMITTCQTTIMRIDENISMLNDMIGQVRTQAHARAIERLGSLRSSSG